MKKTRGGITLHYPNFKHGVANFILRIPRHRTQVKARYSGIFSPVMTNDTLPRSIQLLTDKFIELHGDRTTGDDTSVCVGLAWLEGKKLILISRRTASEIARTQSTQWKIIRLLNIAIQLKKPVILLTEEMDNADAGEKISNLNLSNAIIQNVKTISKLPVPIIGVLCGKPTSVDRIILSLVDCIIVPKETLNSNLPTITGLVETDGQSNSLQTSGLTHIVPIDGAQVISALRQILPSKIDELMSIPPATLIAQRHERTRGWVIG